MNEKWRIRVYLGIYNTKKQEVRMMPTTGMISLVQKVNCFEPTVLETDDVLVDLVFYFVEFRLFET